MKEHYTTADKNIDLTIELPEYKMEYIQDVYEGKRNELNIETKQIEQIITDIDISKSKISIKQYVECEVGGLYGERVSCEIEVFPTDKTLRTITIEYWQIKYCYKGDQLKVTLSSEWLEKSW